MHFLALQVATVSKVQWRELKGITWSFRDFNRQLEWSSRFQINLVPFCQTYFGWAFVGKRISQLQPCHASQAIVGDKPANHFCNRQMTVAHNTFSPFFGSVDLISCILDETETSSISLTPKNQISPMCWTRLAPAKMAKWLLYVRLVDCTYWTVVNSSSCRWWHICRFV